jgi:AraC-like DNA-binding protein
VDPDYRSIRHNGVARCLQFLHRTGQRRLGLGNLIKISGMSRRGLHKAFMTHLGCGPGAVLRTVRVKRACKLLADSELPLDEVATQCGYRNANSLCVVFRRDLGVTPQCFRKQQRPGADKDRKRENHRRDKEAEKPSIRFPAEPPCLVFWALPAPAIRKRHSIGAMTDMKPTAGAVIKTDTLGRVRTSRERREQILDEFARSGLSGQKFEELAGIKYSTFATWAQKRRRAPGRLHAGVPAPAADPMHWLEAVVEQAVQAGGPTAPTVMLALPGGARLEINHINQIALAAASLQALARPG